MSGMVNYNYLRPQKAAMVRKMHQNSLKLKSQIAVETKDNATILPLRKMDDTDAYWGRGGVVDSDGVYIELSKTPNLIDHSYQIDNAEFEDKKVVYCGFFRHHWGEFIAYCLPRLWYSLRNDATIEEYVFFTDENKEYRLLGNFKILLERLGILDKVRIISKPTKFKTVIVPELSYDTANKFYSNEYLRLFDTINHNSKFVSDEKNEKIFLTRSGLKKSASMESGVEMLDDFFSKNGYKVLSPEKISLDELIFYLDNAKTIGCISGTLPHNILFSKGQGEGKNVIVIERNAMFNFFQPETDLMTNANITFIDANISLYPVELSYGPFIYYNTKYLEKFADDNDYIKPDDCYKTEKYKKALFRDYLKRYKTEHGLCLYMPQWNIKCSSAIFEAYYEAEEFFYDYLKGIRFYKFSQYLSVVYLKRIIKKLLRR